LACEWVKPARIGIVGLVVEAATLALFAFNIFDMAALEFINANNHNLIHWFS